jgi:hypothetical protein
VSRAGEQIVTTPRRRFESRPARVLIVIVATSLVAGGCATVGNGRLASLDEAGVKSLLAPGEKTEAGVRDALGQGTVIRFESGYETWHYVWREGLSKGWDDVPFIGLVTSRSKRPTKELVLLFDPSGTLRRWSFQVGGVAAAAPPS